MSVDNIKLGHSPLSDKIYLYRHGKDPALALEKRDAEKDVICVLIDHMMHDAPKGSEKIVTLDGQQYRIRLEPVKAEVQDG